MYKGVCFVLDVSPSLFSCMKIIDKIIESISSCLSLIFWVIVALICAGILALLS